MSPKIRFYLLWYLWRKTIRHTKWILQIFPYCWPLICDKVCIKNWFHSKAKLNIEKKEIPDRDIAGKLYE